MRTNTSSKPSKITMSPEMYLQFLLSIVYLLKARKTVIAAEKRRHFVLWKKETHNSSGVFAQSKPLKFSALLSHSFLCTSIVTMYWYCNSNEYLGESGG